MRLYLIQHGRATTEDEDPRRPLTDDGIADATRVAHHGAERLGVRAARVVHSGKARACETAEIWGVVLDVEVEPADALGPKDDPTTWAERLDAEVSDLMLVGHLPHLGRLAGLLLTGDADRSVVSFREGGLVGLEQMDTGWLVSVVLPPEGA